MPEGLLTSCSFDYLSQDYSTRSFIFIFFVAAWLLPFTVIVYCYGQLVKAVYFVRKKITTIDGQTASKGDSIFNKYSTTIVIC